MLSLLELGLRLAHFGYPTSFLLPFKRGGEIFYVQNNQFGWRFFGPRLSRLPSPIFIPQSKSSDTVRIFIFGESAAFGDPQPDFGLPRMLEALLSLRYPGTRFEVVNAGMTAINSNVILPIAADCSKADGDIWVIYMGNNEVVGPFGAGTVFGSRAPPLPLIRANIAVQEFEIGQMLSKVRQWVQKSPSDKKEWGGMAMFVHQQVRADDPRMAAVYDHFQKNLSAIINAGQRKRVGIVASTVAVNLKDCAPFGSSCKPNLPEDQRKKLEVLCQLGSTALDSGNFPLAMNHFSDAEKIDDTVADVHFQLANCDLHLDDKLDARREFSLARDADTLRFRCDSKMNRIIRDTVAGRERDRVLLADSELAFNENSPDGVPGENYFYEHVHLNFDGNFLLAKTIAEQVEKLLPKQVLSKARAGNTWPSQSDCARRLGWSDRDQLHGLSEIYARLADPPFTAQLNHSVQLQSIEKRMRALVKVNQSLEIEESKRACERALTENPTDAFLHQRLGLMNQETGDLDGGIMEAQRAVDLLPSYAEAWAALGVMHAQKQNAEEAFEALKQALELDPMNALFIRNFALSEVMLGHCEAAVRDFQRALSASPHYGPAWLGLGTVFEQMGHNQEAMNCYRNALANRVPEVRDLLILAHFFKNRGWFDGASVCYEDAIKLNPWNEKLYAEASQNLESWAKTADVSSNAGSTNLGGAQTLAVARLNLAALHVHEGH